MRKEHTAYTCIDVRDLEIAMYNFSTFCSEEEILNWYDLRTCQRNMITKSDNMTSAP